MAEFTRQDTLQKITALVMQELKVDANRLQENITFQELGADSLDMVQLIMKLEETFGIEIRDEDAEGMRTLGDVVTYVTQHRTV